MQRIHIHWHVNIQADGICSWGSVNLIDKPGTSLGHKTNIPILGSKQRLNLQGHRESLAGKGGPSTTSCLGACSCLFLKWGGHWRSQRVQETIRKSTWLLPPGASAASWPLSFLCTDQPWPRTVHMERCGDTTNSREMGMVTPNECCFPQSNPPLLIFPKPLSQFARWNSVDHYLKEMRDTSAV